MKTFTLIFEDAHGNELTKSEIIAFTKKEAKGKSRIILATSRLNDLFKIVVK